MPKEILNLVDFFWTIIQELSKFTGLSETGIVLLIFVIVLFIPVIKSWSNLTTHSGKYL